MKYEGVTFFAGYSLLYIDSHALKYPVLSARHTTDMSAISLSLYNPLSLARMEKT